MAYSQLARERKWYAKEARPKKMDTSMSMKKEREEKKDIYSHALMLSK